MTVRQRWIAGAVIAALAAGLAPARAGAGAADDIRALRREIEELRRRDRERRREIEALEVEVQRLRTVGSAPQPAASPSPLPAATALDRAVGALATAPGAAAAPGTSTTLAVRQIGSAEIKRLDVSLDLMVAAGGATVPDGEIGELQGGDHDPKRRGFTLQQAELSFAGTVDPYFTAEAHLVAQPDGVELEEAFFTSTALPWNLQLKGGYFLTEFGRINPTHPHAWDWIDQPLVVTRMFGGEGLRSPGSRLAWLSPLPWFSEVQVGIQDAGEEHTTTSFMGDEAIGGRPVEKTATASMADLLYLARWKNAWNWSDALSTQIGLSGLFGPNATGGAGRTYVYGTDVVWKWQPPDHFRGWPFVTWQAEVIGRDYHAAPYVDAADPGASLPAATLRDWGLYTQALWGFRYQWAAGLRYEYAGGSGSGLGGRQNDPRRDDRHRVAPLIVWQPSEYTRLRLQYDFDHAEFLPAKDAHGVWLGFEVLYGAHPAHQY